MMYTVKEVAKQLKVSTSTVTHFVDSGQLDAIDVSKDRGRHRSLRIPEDALRQFLERRRVFVPPPRARRGHQPRPRQVIDFFAQLDVVEGGKRRLKISEAADYMGVKPDRIRSWIAYGHLRAINMGGTGKENRYRILEEDLHAFIERLKAEPRHLRNSHIRVDEVLQSLEKRQQELSKTE